MSEGGGIPAPKGVCGEEPHIWQKGRYPPEGGGKPCQPAQAPGAPGGTDPPSPRPVGPGAKSDPGPRTGGDLPGWVGPGLAGRRPRATGWGWARRPWGPGGGGRGWSGLAVRGPRRALGPGRYQGSRLLARVPGTALAPPLPVPLYGRQGETPGDRPAPQPAHGLWPVAIATRPRSRVRPPLSGQWNSPRTVCLRNCGRHGLNHIAGRGEQWRPLQLGVFGAPRPQQWSRSQVPHPRRRTPPDPGRGARSSRIRVTEAGLGSVPQGCCHTSCREALPRPFLRKEWGWVTAPRPAGWVQAPGADSVSVKPTVTGERLWDGDRVYKDLSRKVTQKGGSNHGRSSSPSPQDPQRPRLSSCLNRGPSVIGISALKMCSDPNSTSSGLCRCLQ